MHDVFSYPIAGAMGTVENVQGGEQRGRHVCSRASSFQRGPLLSGEAGIGKSRLTAALMERLESEPHTRLRYFCSPQHTDSALYPVIGQMERAAGLAHGDTAQSKLDKLDALLAQTSTSGQDEALLGLRQSLPLTSGVAAVRVPSSRPTSSVSPLACTASKRLSTEAGRKAAQALTGAPTPLRSCAPRSCKSKRLPSCFRVLSAMTTVFGSATP
jgi:hypothetical protein